MATKREPVSGIQPRVLVWARTTIGLSQDDVAEKLGRSSEEIEAWEKGADAPTYSQLEKLAYQVYKRPLAMFFLPSPPVETLPQHEFRTLPDADLETLHPDTYIQIRRAHAFQLALADLYEDRNPSEKCIWRSVRLSQTDSVYEQAKNIRKFLDVDIADQAKWSGDAIGLKQWRKAIEDAGVFVFKAAFKQKDISGFCFVNDQFPIVYLNNSTTKTRQTFSLLHELAHILLRINGMGKLDYSYIERLPYEAKQIERFCNCIAAEVLIPAADFAREAKGLPRNVEHASDEQFSALANRYGVSREAILRRFLDEEKVSQAFYELKARVWNAQKKAGSGGNWYSNQGAYLSDRFANEVVSRHYQRKITLEQAADFLGMKPKSFPGFEERILQGVSA